MQPDLISTWFLWVYRLAFARRAEATHHSGKVKSTLPTTAILCYLAGISETIQR
jgi:hypothetical protein